MKILLIDDDVNHSLLLKEILSKNGHEGIIAENGVQGFELLQNRDDIGLIIADEVMPYITGSELKDKIEKELDSPPPVYILTGKTSNENWNSKVLYKPVSKEDLMVIVGIAEEESESGAC